MGSEGSDARIGKTKIKKKHCIAAQSPPLLQHFYWNYFKVYSYRRVQCNSKHVGSSLVVLCNGL